MKKISTLIVLVSLLIFGPSACTLFQSCPEVSPYFQIEGLELSHFKTEGSFIDQPVDPGSAITWSDYLLNVDFKAFYFAQLRSGGANLYALSCLDPGYMGTQVGVDTLYLVTLQDYNEEYAANDTLNYILEVNDWQDDLEFHDLSKYLNDNKEMINAQYFSIKLTEGPSEDRELQFELVYVLTSGEEFKQKSSAVNITK